LKTTGFGKNDAIHPFTPTRKTHSKWVEKITKYTQNEWGRFKPDSPVPISNSGIGQYGSAVIKSKFI
jgi:hypothetical protein